ncbi:MAG: hypothetical protein V3T17_02825 [Pseudomonadales bacterium]
MSHYQPVAFVEVHKGSLIAAVHNHENGHKPFDVRIWSIPDAIVNIAMAGQGCKICGESSAKMSGFASKLTGIASKLATACGGSNLLSDALMNGIKDFANGGLPSCAPTLIYDSGSDVAWKTGCRDIILATVAVGAEMRCRIPTSYISNTFISDCMGKWGSVYPRQMIQKNDNPIIASAMAAYRAIHLSAFSLDTFPYSASATLGKLQMVSPYVSVGFAPGSAPLDKQLLFFPAREAATYTYVWWVPVTCCKSTREIAGLCSQGSSC